MASPTRYTLSYSFDDFQVANPTTPLPADKLEIELSNVKLTTDQIIDNLNLIQRSDGRLNNGIVNFDSLSSDTKVLLGSSILPRGNWVTATIYKKLDLVTQSGSTYICVVDHTSGVFATDLAAVKWQLWAASASVTVNDSNWSGTDLSVSNGGTGVSTLTGLVKGNGTSAFTAAVAGTDYYAPSGTDVAIADGGTGSSTAAGARTNLGLGALAVLGSVNDGNWSGTDLAITNGGTGASNIANARTNLDLYSKAEVNALIPVYPATSLYQTAGTTIPNDLTALTTILFDTEEYDDSGWHSTVTNIGRVTVDFTGRVHIVGTVAFGNTGSTVRALAIKKNGTIVKFTEVVPAGGGSTLFAQCVLQISGDFTCASTDYFELCAMANAAATATTTGIDKTSFIVRRVK